MTKIIKAWAIVDNSSDFPIPNIVRKVGKVMLYPSCIFSTKKRAEKAKEKVMERYYDDFKIVPIEIKILCPKKKKTALEKER